MMRKGFLLLFVSIFNINFSLAQSQNDFQNEIELLFGELEKTIQQIEPLINSDLINQLDSLDLNQLGFATQKIEEMLEGKDLDKLSVNDIMDIIRIQVEMMEDLDFSQFDQLFKDFGLEVPNIPKLNEEEQDQKPAKGKKRRKSYKL